MTRPARFSLAALALLAAAGGLLLLPEHVVDVPLRMPLEVLAFDLDGWRVGNHVPGEVLPVEPGVPEHLLRTYENGSRRVWVSVGYYPNQVEGRRPPARQLMFPAHGWTDLTEETVHMGVGAAGSIPANLVVVRAHGQRVGILYWYQLGRQSIASDHWYRAMLLYNRLVRRRAEGSLVRVGFPIPEGTEPAAALDANVPFIRAFYPELLRTLPR